MKCHLINDFYDNDDDDFESLRLRQKPRIAEVASLLFRIPSDLMYSGIVASLDVTSLISLKASCKFFAAFLLPNCPEKQAVLYERYLEALTRRVAIPYFPSGPAFFTSVWCRMMNESRLLPGLTCPRTLQSQLDLREFLLKGIRPSQASLFTFLEFDLEGQTLVLPSDSSYSCRICQCCFHNFKSPGLHKSLDYSKLPDFVLYCETCLEMCPRRQELVCATCHHLYYSGNCRFETGSADPKDLEGAHAVLPPSCPFCAEKQE